MIKVLHVITRMIKGGAQDDTLLTVVKLNKSRYQVSLATGPSIGPEGEIESKARQMGVDLTVIPELVREISPIKDAIALYKLYRYIKKGGYDIVHTHSSKAGILGRVAAKLADVKIIIHTPHSHVFYGYYGRFVTQIFVWIERFAAYFTDRIISLTPLETKEHLEFGVGKPSQFTVVYSGVELKPFLNVKINKEQKRQEFGLNDSDKVCIFVARLVPVKGHQYLISAMPYVINDIPSAKLVLVGDGELRSELENQALRLGIKEKVIFTGLRDDIPELLAMSDLFVLSSINEGMGKVLVEAMAVGLPVVATNVGGVSAVVVDGETGILVPPKDPKALSDAIIQLLSDTDISNRMGEAGRKRVDPDFSVEAMIEKIENIYEELIMQKMNKTIKNEHVQ
ncbi:TPA: glycosyltransferase family 1 protein [Candidatus Poribacteria bacterium]|nr:glycosyltransferase family 1 protein [Candidatus Poribacteria bacterium]